jgi:carbonic anhydrase
MSIREMTGLPAASATTHRRAAWLASSLLFWLVAVGWPTPGKLVATADEAATVPSSVSPADALQRLKEGNQRFVAGKPLHQRQNAARRAELVSAQHPFAAILGCSDSRVPLEIVFDQGLGDLFAVRVAGNVAGGDERGSLQYAVAHLHVPLVVVLGHERCGAVSAALSPPSELAKEAGGVQELVARIVSNLKTLPASADEEERVHKAVEANVRGSLQQLRDAAVLKEKIAGGEIRVVGAVYELDSGRVRWLSD